MPRSLSRLSLLILALGSASPSNAETPAPEAPDRAPAEPDVPDAPVPDAPLDELRPPVLPKLVGPKLEAPQVVPAKRQGADVPSPGVVRFQHHGLFRFRPELLVGADLGPGSSPVPEPLGLSTATQPDASTLAWASVRLRYEPTVFIGSNLEIHLGLDALENLVLGSTQSAAGPGLVADVLAESQAPPASGSFGWKDALTVRQAWMRWLAFDTVDLRAGRMLDHYGLGIFRNEGSCEDCDFGSVVDRVAASFTISGFRVQGAWEFTAVGATSDLALVTDRAALGQAKDLGQEDDVSTYTLQVGRFPTTMVERRERTKSLDEARAWAIDWSLFSAFTDQPRSSSEQVAASSIECAATGELQDGQPIQAYDCIRLFRRGAFFWRPGFWLRAERRHAVDEDLRVELELAGIFGSVAHPQRLQPGDDEVAKTFQGLGLAGEIEWRRAALGLGFDFGFATGDDGQHVGVLDGQDVVDPNDNAYATNDALRGNGTITSFFFNRDYHIDLILFRQVLGAVTNAAYMKPWMAIDLMGSDDMTLALRFDLLYALAMRPSGTPGHGDHWGLELDGKVVLDLTSGFRATLAAGVMVPFDALADPATGVKGDPAGAIRALLGWRF